MYVFATFFRDKQRLTSNYLSVGPSVRLYQGDSQMTNILGTSYLRLSLKFLLKANITDTLHETCVCLQTLATVWFL